ncbi:MAG TPA: hypothetical protein VFH85_04230 [Gammaproteobacteria bacterium]|nr:hypothetical protein [Gammaproteobacteria bacterium]
MAEGEGAGACGGSAGGRRNAGKSLRRAAFSAGASLALICASSLAATPSSDQLVQKLLKSMPPGTLTNAHVCKSNGVTVGTFKINELVPNISGHSVKLQKSGDMWTGVTISEKEGLANPVVALSFGQYGDNNFGIVVQDRKTGGIVLTAGDSDGDGHLDQLRYTALDKAGSPVVEITDFDMDGQADFRMYFDKRPAQLWYEGKWRDITKKGHKGGIYVEGMFRPITNEHGRLIVE